MLIEIRFALRQMLAPMILAMVMRQGAMIVTAGLAVGLAGAVATTRGVETMLYGIGARDTTSFAAAALLLALVALAAVFLPARQAARTDSQQSLRAE